MKIPHLRLPLILAAFVLMLSLASCGSGRTTARRTSAGYSSSSSLSTSKTATRKPKMADSQPAAHFDPKKVSDNPTTLRLLSEADSWIGTPYAWGGNDRNGVDCSGFVLQVYLNSLNIGLPRNSEKQMQYCTAIGKSDLVPGDLVFFTVRGGDRVGHVGIYIGNNNFVHSSSSKGVIVTSLDNPYFVKNYFSCGRVERYMAMINESGKAAKPGAPANYKTRPAREVAPRVQQPVMAAAKSPGVQPAGPASKSSSAIAARQAKKKDKKKAAAVAPDFSTPLPSQVFASKNETGKTDTDKSVPVPRTDLQEEEPDFFD